VQDAPDHLVVTIARSEHFTRHSEADLRRGVRQFVGPTVRVEIKYVSLDELRPSPGAKFRSVISHVRSGTGSPGTPTGA